MGEPPGQPKTSIAPKPKAGLAGSVDDPHSPSTSSGQAPRRGLRRVVRRPAECKNGWLMAVLQPVDELEPRPVVIDCGDLDINEPV